jgi:nitroimidazol reductase NimA-like FMN-containing flavoprotein (pyridoxamine 5'-phosphate oxidase superfamily)
MDNTANAKQTLTELFTSQLQAVLATQNQQQPYTSLMAFVATADLTKLLFATYRETHKYRNLVANPRAALLIDNRTAQLADHYSGIAVTATGSVKEVAPAEKEKLLQLYLARHPNLEDFVTCPACALMEMRVEHYYIVSQFHNVIDLFMAQ